MGSCLSSRDDKKKRSLEASRPRTGLLVTELKEKNGVIGMHGSSMESAQFQNQLHRIPGRMLLNGSSCMASLFTQKGLKGTNQDAMIVWENVGSRKGVVFCGVFDGHGPFGHLVARRVRDSLPLKLIADWEMSLKGSGMRKSSISNHSSKKSEEIESIFVEDESKAFFVLEDNVPEVFVALKESFLKAFKFMDKDLMQHPNIDCFTSGTTAATLVKLGQHVMIGNVGDSRAVLGTRDHEDNLVAVQLTMDLKPNLPEEAERIRRCRGGSLPCEVNQTCLACGCRTTTPRACRWPELLVIFVSRTSA
ncbi:hypothetical protein HPP92_021391 [Vanilla planifolia]|uniref:protein-serine/threonine phosphatase n=1 Tax=Vanilla planifolia TaxID=51239 RepID=A0A835UFG9_VANPL|nr:hypothetical protein HPP92_021391 [Vanilla planifolia]